MQNKELSLSSIPAEGPEGLKMVLEQLLLKAQENPTLTSDAHYILYTMGQQKSLIKVDMSQKPFHFWYYDLMGRPATNLVKETIARFLWEKGGEKEKYLQELGEE